MTSLENTFFFLGAGKGEGGAVTEVKIFFPQTGFATSLRSDLAPICMLVYFCKCMDRFSILRAV